MTNNATRNFAERTLTDWCKDRPDVDPLTRADMIAVFLGDPEYWEWKGWSKVFDEAMQRMLGEKPFPK